MASKNPSQESPEEKGQWFEPTRWTLVVTARDQGGAQAQEALEQLCRTYWPPLYSYVRSRGHTKEKAEDLTQAFFCQILQRDFLGPVERKKGKFRSYLLASMNYFLANEREYENAQKRGGGRQIFSLDDPEGEVVQRQEPSSDLTPEKAYELEWARTLLRKAHGQLGQEYSRDGKGALFDALKHYLEEETDPAAGYQDVAAALGMTSNHAAVAVYRLRQRYRELIRQEVAHTVCHPSEVPGEMRHIFEVLSRR